tara:strand:- start:270 stop:1121 length:852 start_codon:yes stop_codon:yes gene_type:complete
MSNATVSRDDDDNAMSIANSVTNVIPVPNYQPTYNIDGKRKFVRWSDAEIDALNVISRDPNFKANQKYDGKKIRIQMIEKGYPVRDASAYCKYISQCIKPDIEKEVQAEQARLVAVAAEEQQRQAQAQREKKAREEETLQEVMNQQFLERQVKDIHIDTPELTGLYSPLELVFYYYGFGLWYEYGLKGPASQATTTWLISRLFKRKLTEAAINGNHPIVYRSNVQNSYKGKNRENKIDSEVCQQKLKASLRELPQSYQTAWTAVLRDHTDAEIRQSVNRCTNK